MTYLFNQCTFFDSDLRTVGHTFIDRFRNRTGGTYQNPILNSKVSQSSALKNFLKRFGEKLRASLIASGGDINSVTTIDMGNDRPIFNGFYNKFHGLQIL